MVRPCSVTRRAHLTVRTGNCPTTNLWGCPTAVLQGYLVNPTFQDTAIGIRLRTSYSWLFGAEMSLFQCALFYGPAVWLVLRRARQLSHKAALRLPYGAILICLFRKGILWFLWCGLTVSPDGPTLLSGPETVLRVIYGVALWLFCEVTLWLLRGGPGTVLRGRSYTLNIITV